MFYDSKELLSMLFCCILNRNRIHILTNKMSGGTSDKISRRSFRENHSLSKGRIFKKRLFRGIPADDRGKGRDDNRIDLFKVSR